MNIRSTLGSGARSLKLLVYGVAGVGKTSLVRTISPDEPVLIVSAEKGTLSIADMDLAVVDIVEDAKEQGIKPIDVLTDVYRSLREDAGKTWKWVILDSATEIAEACLLQEKESSKDGRKAYGQMADRMKAAFRSFRDLPHVHVVLLAHEHRSRETGQVSPSFPGSQLSEGVPYLFDEVFHMVLVDDDEGEKIRVFRTDPGSHHSWVAKDRSGALSETEYADLNHVRNTIHQVIRERIQQRKRTYQLNDNPDGAYSSKNPNTEAAE